ncbi:L-arabinose transport system permease protein AraQ [subsurface metagenome]
MKLILKRKLTTTLFYICNILLSILFLAPLVWMVVSSFKPEISIFSDLKSIKAFLPTAFTIENYVGAVNRVPMIKYLLNSAFFVTTLVFLGLVVNSLCGFALAKLKFRYRNQLLSIIIALIIIPLESILLPLYFLAFKLNMLGSYNALIFPFVANCFSIFLFRQFFVNIPDELLEAAYIDGAHPIYVFFKIIVPSSLPVYATVLILQAIEHWGSFLWPILVTSEKTKTIQLGLQTLFASQPIKYGPVLAGLTIATIPIVLLFMFFQRYYIQGICTSGMKG